MSVEIYSGKITNIKPYINNIGFHITRLKAISLTNAFIAINNNLYEIHIEYPSKYKIEKGRQGPFISRPIELKNIKILNNNKPILSMKNPIQNININKNIISCIDNHGIIKIYDKNQSQSVTMEPPPLKKRKLNNNNNNNNHFLMMMKYENGLLNNKMNNNNNLLNMSGYCSFDINNNNNNKFIAISNYYNLLNIFDINNKNKIIGNIYLPQKPTTIKYYNIPNSGNNSSVILINEGNILSIWDERINLKLNKCIKRINLKYKMYSIDINKKSSSKYISCCGLSKIVYIIDPFKWNIHSMWKSQSKYQLLQCKFSKFDNYGKYIYCIGMDKDLICGQWETNKKQLKQQIKKTNDLRFQYCFRADSNWIGADYVMNTNFESMIGITNTATIYIAHKPHILHCK